MIDIEKLLARCDFHIGRGENMTIDPAELKEALKPAPVQKPFCYMSDTYEVGLFASKPDNPAYADFFPVFKELQPAPNVPYLMFEEIKDCFKKIEDCFKNTDETMKLMALVPLGKFVRLKQALEKHAESVDPREDERRILNAPIGQLILGGAEQTTHGDEFGENDVELNDGAIQRLQALLVNNSQPVKLDIYANHGGDKL